MSFTTLRSSVKAKKQQILAISLLVFSFFIFNSVKAVFTYYSSFETEEGYIAGSVDTQNNWSFLGIGTIPEISTTTSKTGFQSLKIYNEYGYGVANTGAMDPLGVGGFSFWIYPSGSFQDFKVVLTDDPDYRSHQVGYICQFAPLSPNCLEVSFRLSASTFHYVEIRYNIPENEVLAYVDGYNINTLAWYEYDYHFTPTGEIKYISILAEANSVLAPVYVDDLTWGAGYDVSGVVNPEFVPTGYNTMIGGIFNLTGTYSYINSTQYFISDLSAVFTDKSDNTKQFVFNADISSSTAGTYKLPVKLSNGTYDLSYRFVYNVPSIQISEGQYLRPDLSYDIYYYYPYMATTTLRIIDSYYNATTSPEFKLPTPENCDILSGAEQWLCKIKNVLQSIFLPSQQKVAELTDAMKGLNQKFPSNYLGVAYDFFSGVKDSVNETSTISFKILGKAGNVNFGVLNSTSSIAGSTQTIKDVFRGFFGFIFLTGFISYAVNYGKRIFK